MFQFPELAPICLCIQHMVAGIHRLGFPIRRSSNQSLCSDSSKLFAATYVLHRLLVPRHPPHALSSLASFLQRHLLASRITPYNSAAYGCVKQSILLLLAISIFKERADTVDSFKSKLCNDILCCGVCFSVEKRCLTRLCRNTTEESTRNLRTPKGRTPEFAISP